MFFCVFIFLTLCGKTSCDESCDIDQRFEKFLKYSEEIILKDLPASNRSIVLNSLVDIFWNVSVLKDGMSGNSQENFNSNMKDLTTDKMLWGGVAIAPLHATEPLGDHTRTVSFMKGVHSAVLEKRRTGSQKVVILYAGSGPFAPLVLPLVSFFSPAEVGFIILDVHPASIESVKSIVSRFCLSEYIINIQSMDATEFDCEWDVDVIVIETMTSALRGEPQVILSSNLVRKFPHATLVPKSIQIDLVVAHKRQISFECREDLRDNSAMVIGRRVFKSTVFRVNKESIVGWGELEDGTDFINGIDLHGGITKEDDEEFILLTTVELHDNIRLDEGTCSLTLPQKLLHGDVRGSLFNFVRSVKYSLSSGQGSNIQLMAFA